ncbi:16S rRNA (cytosine(967)-C(5))-methyltransferase RsmB [Aquincola sp. S2]|uniref:16S rRNA (Cytosine(967)-C(5))-methyltransferase RsmB n=1 Tax=Pseudaquabacterium terrae TaxID=2732868 RepID=A0ABX2ECA4_9BURK|nr:16S rRNA (cytosine(967)-C(5))-methyltransferase RsmB [Aquabacterium terrae]NRF66198.1 16S rRNA (cytosine(967)-C(5))-methyltransferase RsmB [Aquabacterium terrae]
MATAPSPPLARLLDQTADAVAAVRSGRSLTEVLARCPVELKPGTQALSFHVLRWWGGAQAVRALMAPKAPPANVDALLCSAIALLWPGSEPPYAEHTLVDQAVGAARQRTPAAANFVNAVLRRFVRERDALVAAVQPQPIAAFNHPLWWIERIKQDWPQHWQALLGAANKHPPMVLRVNARRGTAAAYVQRLAAQGRGAQAIGEQAVLLDKPLPVTELPGFAEGEVSVQDLSAQRAGPLLLGAGADRLSPPGRPKGEYLRAQPEGVPVTARARVLDACAAPGGKTAQLLELADVDLLALDSDPLRLTRVQETLNRLQLKAHLQVADAREPARWWDGRPFDAILLDAPCTASGIVRRHPDVRWLRRPDDVVALSRIQAELLDALWPLLAPGGRLLYATCSVFRLEGQQQIDAFLQRHAADKPWLDPASPGHLPGLPDNAPRPGFASETSGDGFFYALIHKP